MGLDWFVFSHLKTADDKTLEAFGFETGVKSDKRWYKDINAFTYLLLNTLEDFDELWTLGCGSCLEKHIALHFD